MLLRLNPIHWPALEVYNECDCLDNHAGSDGFVGAGVDEDEAAGVAVATVTVVNEGTRGADADPADVVHRETVDAFDLVQGIDINVVFDFAHDCLGLTGGVAQDDFASALHWFVGEPTDHGFQVLTDLGRVVRFDDHVAARDIDLIFEGEGDALRRETFFERAISGVDLFDRGGETGREDDDVIARLKDATGDPAGVTAEIMPFIALRANDPLHRESGVDVIFFTTHVDVLQVIKEGRPLVPRHRVGFFHDIIAFESGDGNGGDIDDIVEAGSEFLVVLDDLTEDGFVIVNEVHFVDCQDDVLDAQKVRDEAVAFGLLDDAFPGVNQNDGQIGGGGAGDHVAGVLDMARGVSDDEFPFRGREITVSDVDGNSLFAFGFQSVGEQGEVDVLIAAPS